MASYKQSKMELEKAKRRRELKERILSFRHFFAEFLVILYVYGFFLNFAASALFGFPFLIYTIPGWGVLYYFLRYELCGPNGVVSEWIRLARH